VSRTEAQDAGEWRTYGRDDTQQRFSPLTDINKKSVNKLGLKWALDLPNETSLVSTPLMVRDTLYFTGKFSAVTSAGNLHRLTDLVQG
jgi:quinohemoprotein ethanol dehydrogenase